VAHGFGLVYGLRIIGTDMCLVLVCGPAVSEVESADLARAADFLGETDKGDGPLKRGVSGRTVA